MSLNHPDIPNAAVATSTTILNAVAKKLQLSSSQEKQGDNTLNRVHELIHDPEFWITNNERGDIIEDRVVL
jgi:hypothetical protein